MASTFAKVIVIVTTTDTDAVRLEDDPYVAGPLVHLLTGHKDERDVGPARGLNLGKKIKGQNRLKNLGKTALLHLMTFDALMCQSLVSLIIKLCTWKPM